MKNGTLEKIAYVPGVVRRVMSRPVKQVAKQVTKNISKSTKSVKPTTTNGYEPIRNELARTGKPQTQHQINMVKNKRFKNEQAQYAAEPKKPLPTVDRAAGAEAANRRLGTQPAATPVAATPVAAAPVAAAPVAAAPAATPVAAAPSTLGGKTRQALKSERVAGAQNKQVAPAATPAAAPVAATTSANKYVGSVTDPSVAAAPIVRQVDRTAGVTAAENYMGRKGSQAGQETVAKSGPVNTVGKKVSGGMRSLALLGGGMTMGAVGMGALGVKHTSDNESYDY